eukprot:4978205-Lingulodinium_polyedra.AAC.1
MLSGTGTSRAGVCVGLACLLSARALLCCSMATPALFTTVASRRKAKASSAALARASRSPCATNRSSQAESSTSVFKS